MIFISSLHEPVDKVKGFEVGGIDYITKPFHSAEVVARIQTHLALRRLQKQMEEQNAQLQREIAERKEVEAQLRKSEGKYRNLFDNAPLGIFRTTPEGTLLEVNQAFARMFGYESPEEVISTVKEMTLQMWREPRNRQEVIDSARRGVES